MIVPSPQSVSSTVEVVDCRSQLLAELSVPRQARLDAVGIDVLPDAAAHLGSVPDSREQVRAQRLVAHDRIGVRDDLAQARFRFVELVLSS
jgi:hypothetical protein